MHDSSVLVAINAALRSPAHCDCGSSMTIQVRDSAVWLECPTFAKPSRLPVRVAPMVRSILHRRRFVVDLPDALAAEGRPAVPDRVASPCQAVPVRA